MAEKGYVVMDVHGKVFFVDFHKKVLGKNKTVIADVNHRELGDVKEITEKPGPLALARQEIGTGEIESCHGKKISFMKGTDKEQGRVSGSTTDPIARVYREVA